jgi:hypothetical protein
MSVDPALRKSILDGSYVVDPHAVAGAIVGRLDTVRTARRLSHVLVARERDAATVRPEERKPLAGPDHS